MDHQYVVEFDCTAPDSVAAAPESVFERLLDHVADWVGRGADGVDATALLASEGAAEATYIDDKRQYVKNISWRPLPLPTISTHTGNKLQRPAVDQTDS